MPVHLPMVGQRCATCRMWSPWSRKFGGGMCLMRFESRARDSWCGSWNKMSAREWVLRAWDWFVRAALSAER